MTEETWKTISDDPNYEISSLGRVRPSDPVERAEYEALLKRNEILGGGKITLNSSYGKTAQQKPFKDNVNQTNEPTGNIQEE